MVIEYVGTAYAGFQRQRRVRTVQSALEDAIRAATGDVVTLAAAGRTDAGAHALGQMAAFDTHSALPVGTLRDALNVHLPGDIAVTRVHDVPAGFNPRRDAVSRTYRYVILNRAARSALYGGRAWHIRTPLDTERMHDAAQTLIGEMDLGAFVPVRQEGSKIRTVYHAACTRVDDVIAVELEASGFMKQMARAIVGTLVEVGRHRLDLRGFQAIVAARDRTLAAPTAPAHGLYLVDVRYAKEKCQEARAHLAPGASEEQG